MYISLIWQFSFLTGHPLRAKPLFINRGVKNYGAMSPNAYDDFNSI